MRRLLTILFLLPAACATASAPSSAADRAAQFLTACAAGPEALAAFAGAAYADRYVSERGLEGLLDADRRICARTGGLQITSVLVSTRDSYFALARGITSGEPFRLAMNTRDGAIERRSIAVALPPPAAALEVSNLDAHLDTLAASDSFSGVVLVATGDQVLYEGARGFADREAGTKATPATLFGLASVGKMFTAVAIGQLVDAGKLRFDDRLADVLPDFPNRAMAAEITIAELLSHTSGLPMFFDRLDVLEMYVRGEPLGRFLPLIAASQLEPAPRAMYSNAGYLVLGAIIEKLSNRSFAEYVHERIFGPALMRSTHLAPRTPLSAAALTYTFLGTDGIRRQPGCGDRCGREFGGPAGGGYTTARDLFLFLRALHGGRLVRAATLQELTKARVLSPWGTDYGYGHEVTRIGETLFLGHAGDYVGTNAEAVATKGGGVVIVVLSNYERPAATAIADLLKASFARGGPGKQRAVRHP